jgi:gliding motility-associated lipoprotein GldH
MVKSIYYWVVLLLLCACEPVTVYQNTITLPEAQWHVDFLPEFQFQVKDAKEPHYIYLIVEHTPNYPYQNLYLTYYLEDDTQTLRETSLKNYKLFDAKTGKPLGSGFGKTKHHAFVLLNNYAFSQPGLYTLKLEQFMRADALPGLQAIGIKVLRATPTKQ